MTKGEDADVTFAGDGPDMAKRIYARRFRGTGNKRGVVAQIDR